MTPPYAVRLVGLIAALAPLLAGCDPSAPFALGSSASPAPAASVQESAPAAVAAASSPSTAPTGPVGNIPADSDALVETVIKAVNAEREKVGLPPVVYSDTLCGIADTYASRLISADFFAHVDPYTGTTVAKRAAKNGYAYYKVGENLAAGQKTVASAMTDWMASASHRANILDPDFTELGIAIRDGGRYGRYWVQEFGRPLGQ